MVIEITGDGRGLNRTKIIAKAVQKGLIASADGLSDNQIYHLIFEPGFSTAAQVTNASGRGAGMDVVRRHIEKLRGRRDPSADRPSPDADLSQGRQGVVTHVTANRS